jgi:hypothetical protein
MIAQPSHSYAHMQTIRPLALVSLRVSRLCEARGLPCNAARGDEANSGLKMCPTRAISQGARRSVISGHSESVPRSLLSLVRCEFARSRSLPSL